MLIPPDGRCGSRATRRYISGGRAGADHDGGGRTRGSGRASLRLRSSRCWPIRALQSGQPRSLSPLFRRKPSKAALGGWQLRARADMCGSVRIAREGGAVLQGEWLDEERAEAIAHKVREELARRRISRQALADLARISISTLEKALSGRRSFTLATVIRLEEALGTSLRGTMPAAPSSGESAPDTLGGYNHGAVRWLEGRYWTLRPVF